jgi:hypothetical protein
MAFIVKCYPPTLDANQEFSVDVPIFDGSSPRAGDEVFVWEAERRSRSGQAGGRRLAMHGVIVDSANHLSRANVRIRIQQKGPQRSFTIADLEPHRTSKSAAAIPKLARKLYKHSLTKIADLDNDEADLLRSYFPTSQA